MLRNRPPIAIRSLQPRSATSDVQLDRRWSKNRILTVKIGELHEDEANFAFDRLQDIANGVMTREAAQAAVADAFRQMAADRAKKEAADEGHAAK